jgi:phosphoglycolate phosphatase-like HAD superfamily hydrolase
MDRLVLFDIDATLLVTSGQGVAAMTDAGKALFSPDFTADGLEFAGGLDPLLLVSLMESNGHKATPAHLSAFRARYLVELNARLHRNGGTLGRALPGVHELLGRLRDDGVPIGLLTGNFAETGSIKLRACGIDPGWFDPAIWGDASPLHPPRRDHLPAVAMRRVRERIGRDLAPSRITIVGDTLHDVQCARVNGCRSVAVATGKFSQDELRAAGADVVVPDLAAVDEIVRILNELSGLSVARPAPLRHL